MGHIYFDMEFKINLPKMCEVVIFDKTKVKTIFVQTFDHPHNIVHDAAHCINFGIMAP